MRRLKHPLILAGMLVALLPAVANVFLARDLILYNPSNSVPSGFYARISAPIESGRFVTVRARDVAPGYAAARDFTDSGDRFIKRIVAGRGQVVCADGAIVSVDGMVAAHRVAHDAMGRSLPRWSGCRTLRANEVFLLGDTEGSFDGRYWGPTSVWMIEGVWSPTTRPGRVP